MNPSSKFVVATHILTGLHVVKELRGMDAATSDLIAHSVNTNPVVIRRILGQLKGAGLVDSHPGARGGFSLAKSAERITLLDVYKATEDSSLFHFHYSEPSQICPVGSTIQDGLKGVCKDAESAVQDVLAKKTLAQLVCDMMDNPIFQTRVREAIESGAAPGS